MNSPATLTPAIAESLVAWTNQVTNGDDAPIPAVCPVEYLPAMEAFAGWVKNRGTRARKNQRKAFAKKYVESDPALSEIISGAYTPRLVDAPIKGIGGRDDCAPLEEVVKRLNSLIVEYAREGQKGAAGLFVAAYPGQIVYNSAAKAFFIFEGVTWRRDETDLVSYIMSNHVLDLFHKEAITYANKAKGKGTISRTKDRLSLTELEQLAATRDMLFKVSGDLQKTSGRDAAVRYAIPSISIKGSDFDGQLSNVELPVKNGIVNIETGEIRPVQPSDYLTITAPVNYVPGATAPRFQQFLNEIWQDYSDLERGELIAFMQRLLGYSLLAENREAIFPVFWGAGGQNGKDTLLSTLKSVLGDLAGNVDSDVVLTTSKGRATGGATPHLMQLRGKRIAWVSEPEKGAKLSEGLVKHLTGSPEITARNLNENPITWKPTHTLILITNPKPHIDASDPAIWERVMLIPFNITFKDDPDKSKKEGKKDSGLKEKLSGEKEGVLAWLVEGYQEYKRIGLNPPALVKAATKEYRQEEDTLGIFVAECLMEVVGTIPRKKMSKPDLYRIYQAWAVQNGINKPMNGVTFGRELKRILPKYDTPHNVLHFFDIVAKPKSVSDNDF